MRQETMVNNPLTYWLLEASTPSIRYQTYTQLIGLPEDELDVLQARHAIMQTGPVPIILDRQTESGHWANERGYYTPKYVSTHWSLILLAELGVEPTDARFQRGIEYMLNATVTEPSSWLRTGQPGVSCFWGNLVYYAAYAGRIDDPRLQEIIWFLIQEIKGDCQCSHNGGRACAWGFVRALWGLAALPETARTPAINQAIEAGIAFLLEEYPLIKADYPTPENGKVHPLWFDLNFPLFYQVDILFTLRVLADLNALHHPGAHAALDWLEQLQKQDGHWQGRSPYRQRTYKALGGSDETNRWVSLQAARILQQAGRLA